MYRFGLESAFERGWKAEVARQLGVHRSTVGSDFQAAMVRVIAHECLQSLGPNLRHQLKKWLERVRTSVPETSDYGEGRNDYPTGDLVRALDVIDHVDALVEQGRLALEDVPVRWDEIVDLAEELRLVVQ